MAKNKTLKTIIQIAGEISPTLRKSIEHATDKLDTVNVKAMAVAAAATGAFVMAGKAAYDFAKDSTEAAIEFESAMADVAKVVDGLKDSTGATTEAYNEMSDAILKLSTEIPMTAKEITEIVAAAGQSGIASEELLGFAESAAKMATAFDTTAEQAGQWMAQWRTALSMTQSEVIELADQINYLGNTTSEDTNKISAIVSELGSLAQISGVSAGSLAALASATTGIEASVAGTALKNMMVVLTSGTAATKRQAEAFQKLGYDATEMAKAMQEDAEGAILGVLNSISQLDEAEQTSIISSLFGKESLATVAVLANNTKNLAEQFIKVGDASLYAGSMEEEFLARAATTENSMILIRNAIESLKIQVGGEILPYIANAINSIIPLIAEITPVIVDVAGGITSLLLPALTGIVPPITSIISGLAKFVTWLGNTDGALEMLSIIMGTVTALFTAFRIQQSLAAAGTTLWASISGVATTATTALGAAFTFLTSPIGLLIVAIGAVVAAGVLLYKNWDTVVEYLTIAGDRLREFFSNLGQFIGNVFKAPINFMIKQVNNFIGGLNKLKIPDWVPGVGGKGINIPLIPMLAAGGFTDGISIAGEAGTEAVISFDPAYRAANVGYWMKAGEMLGVMDPAMANATRLANMDDFSLTDMTENHTVVYDLGGVVFAPQIEMYGDSSKDELIRKLKEHEEDFFDYLEEWLRQREVGRYGPSYSGIY